jgi:hypothetical protein
MHPNAVLSKVTFSARKTAEGRLVTRAVKTRVWA